MDSFKIQKKIYNQIDAKYPPVIACSHGTLFMYSTADGHIRLFLSGEENNVELIKSPFAESRVTCIAISPAHNFGVACYENGSILIYNLIHNKIVKSLSKELKGQITHITFISDTDFLTFDSKLNLTLFSLVSMSIFGYTVKSLVLNTFNQFPFKLVAPPVHRPVDEIPEHLSTSSYCYAPKFNYVAGISLYKQFIIAKFKPTYQVIYQTNDDDSIEKPYLTFSFHNPDTLYAAYSTTKEIIVLSITTDSNGNYSCEKIFQKPYSYTIHFMSFFSTSFIAVLIDNSQILLYNFHQPDQESHAERLAVDGIFFGDFGKIDVFTPTSIVSFYLNTFASNLEALKNEAKFDDIIELAKKAVNGDPGSTVGLSTDPQIRCLEVEKLINDILKQHLQSRTNFVMKDLADHVVEVMIELKNKGFIANEALPIFITWGGTKEFFTSVLNHDPKGEHFTYNQKFVRDIIDKYEMDEYNQKDEERQQYFNQIKTFLLSLPPKVAKPKWLIDFSLKRKDYMMTVEVCTNRMYDPIMALNLLESVQNSDLIPDVFLNHIFKGNIEMIEWMVTPDSETHKFIRLENAIQASNEKMIEVLKWMNETMANVQYKSRKAAEEAAQPAPQAQESTNNIINNKNKNSNDNSKPLTLLKDLYIYLKEENGKAEAEQNDDDQQTLQEIRDSQLNESSIAVDQNKEVVRTKVTKSKLTNDYYIHAVLMTFIDMKINFQTDLFKVMEDHIIKNCPDSFSNITLKYLIESAFSKEFKPPDLRETLISSLIFNGKAISNQLALSLLSLCELYEYKEASSFIRSKLHLLGDLLKSIIYENGYDDALAFINANYRDDLQSMEDIENVVIYYAPYFIEYNCEKFIDVLTNVRFRILYTDLPKSISVANTRLSFLRLLYTKFDPPKVEKSDQNENGAAFFLKNLTNRIWMNKKKAQKENEDPLSSIYEAYTKKDMDTVYQLSEDYFGSKSKFILPIILKNMSPDKLKEMEKIAEAEEMKEQNEKSNKSGVKKVVEKASSLINGALLYTIQRTIEAEQAKREEKARNDAAQESEREKKERKKQIEQKKIEDFFKKGRSELENNVKMIIPFLTNYFPQDVITVMRKFPQGLIKKADADQKNEQSVTEICEKAGLYDCCAYYEALNGNFESAAKFLRTVIVIDPIKNEKAIIETCQLIFASQKSQDNENPQKRQSQIGWDDKDKDDDNDEEEEEEEGNDDDDDDDENKKAKKQPSKGENVERALFILKSFALQFSKAKDNQRIDLISHVYRKVCDVIELSNVASFEQILCMTKKVYGKMPKFNHLSRSLVVNRIYSGDTSFETREYVKGVYSKSLETEDGEEVIVDNTNEELNKILNGLTCANCNVRLLVGKDPIAILECGHAVHYKPYCCSAASDGEVPPSGDQIQKNMCNLNLKCPICSKQNEEKQ